MQVLTNTCPANLIGNVITSPLQCCRNFLSNAVILMPAVIMDHQGMEMVIDA